jgi:hypothetical protein
LHLYIITAPVTPTAPTLDYKALTNQGDAPTSIYIDYIAYFKRTIVTNPNEYIVLYVLRAPGPDCSIYHLSDTNNYIFKALLIKRPL